MEFIVQADFQDGKGFQFVVRYRYKISFNTEEEALDILQDKINDTLEKCPDAVIRILKIETTICYVTGPKVGKEKEACAS